MFRGLNLCYMQILHNLFTTAGEELLWMIYRSVLRDVQNLRPENQVVVIGVRCVLR